MGTILWDFDGTLARRPGMWSGAMIEALSVTAGYHDVERTALVPHLESGFPWHNPGAVHVDIQRADEWWNRLYPTLEHAYRAVGVEPAVARRAARGVRETYLDPEHWEVYPDVRETLSALEERGYRHQVLSNHVPELPALASALELAAPFDGIWTSGRTGYEKPHPAAFEHVLERVATPGPVWMIGDSYESDVQGANRVGLPAILVRSSDERARYACEDLECVARLVERTDPGSEDPE